MSIHTTTAMTELPWMRRERADANIRRAVSDLRSLAVEDTGWTGYYRAMADTLEAAIKMLDCIEDHDSYSVKVTH